MRLWRDIDPTEAEARLRGLNRRLVELDEAMKGGQQMLARNPESFAAQLSMQSLSQLQERLQTERVQLVRHRARERVAVALNGPAFVDHTASIGQLGVFLIRLQSLFQSIAQAVTVGPRQRGPISHEILRSTDLRFSNVFASSFGMEIYIEPKFDVFGESVAISTLQTLFNLLNATRREAAIAQLSAELGQRSLGHLRRVLSDLSKAGAGFSLDWNDGAGTSYTWIAEREDIAGLQSNVSHLRESHPVQKRIVAALIGASLLRNRFELFDEDRNLIEGKIVSTVKPKLREFFGRTCIATVDQVTIVETLSGETRTYYTLLDIERPEMSGATIPADLQ